MAEEGEGVGELGVGLGDSRKGDLMPGRGTGGQLGAAKTHFLKGGDCNYKGKK